MSHGKQATQYHIKHNLIFIEKNKEKLDSWSMDFLYLFYYKTGWGRRTTIFTLCTYPLSSLSGFTNLIGILDDYWWNNSLDKRHFGMINKFVSKVCWTFVLFNGTSFMMTQFPTFGSVCLVSSITMSSTNSVLASESK